MKLGRKLATLARSLTHWSAPRRKRVKQPLTSKPPERLTEERRLESESNEEKVLEQVRVADLLQDHAHSQGTKTGESKKGE